MNELQLTPRCRICGIKMVLTQPYNNHPYWACTFCGRRVDIDELKQDHQNADWNWYVNE